MQAVLSEPAQDPCEIRPGRVDHGDGLHRRLVVRVVGLEYLAIDQRPGHTRRVVRIVHRQRLDIQSQPDELLRFWKTVDVDMDAVLPCSARHDRIDHVGDPPDVDRIVATAAVDVDGGILQRQVNGERIVSLPELDDDRFHKVERDVVRDHVADHTLTGSSVLDRGSVLGCQGGRLCRPIEDQRVMAVGFAAHDHWRLGTVDHHRVVPIAHGDRGRMAHVSDG